MGCSECEYFSSIADREECDLGKTLRRKKPCSQFLEGQHVYTDKDYLKPVDRIVDLHGLKVRLIDPPRNDVSNPLTYRPRWMDNSTGLVP